jgi:hypothetical protein
MTQVPSFLYSGLDKDTLKLSKQLESLGGGDAKTENIKLHGILVNPINDHESNARVLWDYGQSIAIRDIFQEETSPASETMRYYSVNSTHKLENIVELSNLETGFSKELSIDHELTSIVNDVLDGFNHCILTYGERSSGKTLSMFGDENSSNYLDLKSNNGYRVNGMMDRVFANLYRSIKMLDGLQVTVAIAAWMIKGQHTIDLLSPINEGEVALEFVSVDCPTLDVARKVLYVARSHSIGVRAQINGNEIREEDRGHFFSRIVIHQSRRDKLTNADGNPFDTMMSVLYVADLLGSSISPDDLEIQRLDEQDKVHRRDTSLQIHSLSRLFLEMKSAAVASSSSMLDSVTTLLEKNNPKLMLTSSRDSKLTTLLGPIITGNCLTSIFIYLVQGEAHYSQSKATLQATDGLMQVVSPVYRIKNVPLEALKLKSYETVLPAALLYPSLLNSPVSNMHHGNRSPPKLHGSYEDSINQYADYADLDLAKLASPDLYLATPKKQSSSSSSRLPVSDLPQRTPPVTKASSRVDNIMGEFHSLMAKVDSADSYDPAASSSSSKPMVGYDTGITHRQGMMMSFEPLKPTTSAVPESRPPAFDVDSAAAAVEEEKAMPVNERKQQYQQQTQQREEIIASLQKIRSKSANPNDIQVIDREIARLLEENDRQPIGQSSSYRHVHYEGDEDEDDESDVDSIDSLTASTTSPTLSPTPQTTSLFSTLNLPNRLQDSASTAGIGSANYRHAPATAPLPAPTITTLAASAYESSSSQSARSSSPTRSRGSSRSASPEIRRSQQEIAIAADEYDEDDPRDTVRFRGVHASLLEALNHERAVKQKLQSRIDSFEVCLPSADLDHWLILEHVHRKSFWR